MDLSTAQGIYLGATGVQSVYLGSTLIWPATPPTHDYSQDYFTIVSLEDNNTIYWRTDDKALSCTIRISPDGGANWSAEIPPSYYNNGQALITLNTGEKICIKGNNESYTNNALTYWQQFISTGSYNVEGNIMSLIYGDNFINQTSFPVNSSHNFEGLFFNAAIINASNLILPATTLTDNCYRYMFQNCTSLTTPPELPATTLAKGCYHQLFCGCTSLTTAPDLPATTLSIGCYKFMFEYCTSLTTPPELPATTLAKECYYQLFYDCTSLTTAPDLPATTLTEGCYKQMFQGCSSLNYIKCLATDISASYCLTGWVDGVAASGTFIKDASTTWPTGSSGIPSGWTVQNA